MKRLRKHPQLEELASALVGGDSTPLPNLYFVSLAGTVELVTTNGAVAYNRWRHWLLTCPEQESALEDRTGCLATREPEEEGGTRLITINDAPASITHSYLLQ